jgi:hypothetical protein
MPVWSLAVASGADLSRLTIGSASTVSELYRAPRLLPLTPLGPGLLRLVGPPCSNGDNRFAHASCQTASEADIRAHVTSGGLREPFLLARGAIQTKQAVGFAFA